MKKGSFRTKRYVALLVSIILVLGAIAMFMCFGINLQTSPADQQPSTLESVPREHWASLAKKRIFFGHQSVGYNVLDGIKDIMKDHDYIRLNIVESSDLGSADGPFFAHSGIGENYKPLAKIEAFEDIIDQNADAHIDIALMKLCYVDIRHNSNLDSIFTAYRTTIENIKKQHPNIEILHVTVPVYSLKRYSSAKDRLKLAVKRLIGRPTILEDNFQRYRYNEMLRDAFAETDSIFELAQAESTTSKGRSYYAERSGVKVPFLCIEYTEGGGHLNPLGRRKAAEQLLIVLAKMANK